MARLAGRLLIGIGVLHLLFGLWFGRGPLLRIARDGFFAAVDSHPDRGLVFWFLFASPMLWIIGQLVVWAAARGLPPPAWLGGQVLAVSVMGAALMPASGFWLVLVTAVLLLAASRRPPGPEGDA